MQTNGAAPAANDGSANGSDRRLLVLCTEGSVARDLEALGIELLSTDHREDGSRVVICDLPGGTLSSVVIEYLWESDLVEDYTVLPGWAAPQVVKVFSRA